MNPEGKPWCARSDPRMNRAVEARLTNPGLSLYECLCIGGFDFAADDASAMDSEGVTLTQRKNQLNRRLRSYRKRLSKVKTGKSTQQGGINPSRPSVPQPAQESEQKTAPAQSLVASGTSTAALSQAAPLAATSSDFLAREDVQLTTTHASFGQPSSFSGLPASSDVTATLMAASAMSNAPSSSQIISSLLGSTGIPVAQQEEAKLPQADETGASHSIIDESVGFDFLFSKWEESSPFGGDFSSGSLNPYSARQPLIPGGNSAGSLQSIYSLPVSMGQGQQFLPSFATATTAQQTQPQETHPQDSGPSQSLSATFAAGHTMPQGLPVAVSQGMSIAPSSIMSSGPLQIPAQQQLGDGRSRSITQAAAGLPQQLLQMPQPGNHPADDPRHYLALQLFQQQVLVLYERCMQTAGYRPEETQAMAPSYRAFVQSASQDEWERVQRFLGTFTEGPSGGGGRGGGAGGGAGGTGQNQTGTGADCPIS